MFNYTCRSWLRLKTVKMTNCIDSLIVILIDKLDQLIAIMFAFTYIVFLYCYTFLCLGCMFVTMCSYKSDLEIKI